MSEKTDLGVSAAVIDRLAEQRRARNLLTLATLRHRRIKDLLVKEAESIITGTPSEPVPPNRAPWSDLRTDPCSL